MQRLKRYKQLIEEVELALVLESRGWRIFSPTAVCDRIGVKKRKVCFLEFKRRGQKLTGNQDVVRGLAPSMYKIFYSN